MHGWWSQANLDKPDHIILHTRTKDLQSEKTSSQILKSIIELAMSLKSNRNYIIVSGIALWFDNLNNKVNEVNNSLAFTRGQRDVPFIYHSEIKDSSEHIS